ncbi:hypothetical protein NL676_032420 [Syzygium grande]|nr:hypothetical protein NL676_032420 [Syzygium grande]
MQSNGGPEVAKAKRDGAAVEAEGEGLGIQQPRRARRRSELGATAGLLGEAEAVEKERERLLPHESRYATEDNDMAISYH